MEIIINSKNWQDAIDITEEVGKVVLELWEKEKKLICNVREDYRFSEHSENHEQKQEGFPNKKSRACFIFCPHTTAGLTINEGYDKSVMKDVLDGIDELTPRLDFEHKEGNSPSHIKASLVGSSLLIPIKDGKLELGKWQKIFFLEFDGGKERKVRVEII